jgi:two-component sensor histidine kinase/HAMP domain-containing protein
MKFWHANLMVRLVGYFLFLSLATTGLVGYIAYIRARTALTDSAYDRLTAVTLLKEDDLQRWVDDQVGEILYVAAVLESYTQARALLQLEQTQTPSSDPAYQAAYADLAVFLSDLRVRKPGFQEAFILTGLGGKILVSTEPTHEGGYRVLDTYFVEGQQETYVQKVYPSPITGLPTITIATPLKDEAGGLLGVLAVHLNLDTMDRIVLARAGLGESGETYMVDAYNVLVSSERFGRATFPRGVHTVGIDAALQGKTGSALYANYEGDLVIGAYRWVDELGIALLSEMSQTEAFAAARRLATTISLVGIGSAVLLGIGVYLLARQIARPILAITETAVKVAAGDLSQTAPVATIDEVGLLARTFNQMTAQLRILYAGLEEKVSALQEAETALRQAHDELEMRVEERTDELTLLNRAGETLISTLDQDQVLNIVLEELRRLLNVVACSVWLVDEETDELVCRQSSGPQSGGVYGWRLAKGAGVAGWVVENGRSLLLDDAQEDPRHHIELDHSMNITTRALLTIPLHVRGRVIGAIQAMDNEPSRFNVSDQAVMESLAATSAFAIENAQLYSQARDDAAARATLLREVNHRVKNNLSAIIGLLYAERRHADLKDRPIYQEIMQDLISRVQGLATVHNLLSISQWEPISLTELANQIIHAALRATPLNNRLTATISPSPVHVTPDQANYLALVINELTTNSVKYALPEKGEGRIIVHIVRVENMVTLNYSDDGPGYPDDVLRAEAPRYNAGLHLLKNIVAHSLGGNLILQNISDGRNNNGGAMAIIQFAIGI